MLTELFLAGRYLKPKRNAVSLITLSSVLGVTLGVAVLMVVLAVMTGFTDLMKQKLVETQASFGVRTRNSNTSCGPSVTRYELQPESGVKVKAIANLADDIALHLAATSIRMECPIPGKSAVGIELPNKTVTTVRLRDLIANSVFRDSKEKLLVCLGVDIGGNPVYLNIAKMPHLLVAGATGMGKSVCINSMIVSLLYHAKPDEVKPVSYTHLTLPTILLV